MRQSMINHLRPAINSSRREDDLASVATPAVRGDTATRKTFQVIVNSSRVEEIASPRVLRFIQEQSGAVGVEAEVFGGKAFDVAVGKRLVAAVVVAVSEDVVL